MRRSAPFWAPGPPVPLFIKHAVCIGTAVHKTAKEEGGTGKRPNVPHFFSQIAECWYFTIFPVFLFDGNKKKKKNSTFVRTCRNSLSFCTLRPYDFFLFECANLCALCKCTGPEKSTKIVQVLMHYSTGSYFENSVLPYSCTVFLCPKSWVRA